MGHGPHLALVVLAALAFATDTLVIVLAVRVGWRFRRMPEFVLNNVLQTYLGGRAIYLCNACPNVHLVPPLRRHRDGTPDWEASRADDTNAPAMQALVHGGQPLHSVEWVPDNWKADPDEIQTIARIGCSLLADPRSAEHGLGALEVAPAPIIPAYALRNVQEVIHEYAHSRSGSRPLEPHDEPLWQQRYRQTERGRDEDRERPPWRAQEPRSAELHGPLLHHVGWTNLCAVHRRHIDVAARPVD